MTATSYDIVGPSPSHDFAKIKEGNQIFAIAWNIFSSKDSLCFLKKGSFWVEFTLCANHFAKSQESSVGLNEVQNNQDCVCCDSAGMQ